MVLHLLLACAGGTIPLGDAVDTGADTADTGAAAPTPYGSGADGALVVDDAVDLSAWRSGSRASPDAATARVVGLDGTSVMLAAPPEGFARGDLVLLLNAQGTREDHEAVGRYAFARLAAVTSTLSLEEPLNLDLGDPATQVVVVQRVPQYTTVTVASTGILTTSAWDGEGGGVLAFVASDGMTVADGGVVTVSALGYAGGPTGTISNNDGFQGESWLGPGAGDHTGSEGYNEYSGEWAANGGGGGANITGGGGEHAGGATAGVPWIAGATAPQAGETAGEADLSVLILGSGGGGVWNDGTANAGPGGAGGGILFVAARSIAAGAGAFSATGETATSWSQGTYSYGAGGGAGGTIWLRSDTLELDTASLDARGGLGESAHQQAGGDGGVGRIRVDCGTIGGATCSAETLAGVATPEVGFVGER